MHGMVLSKIRKDLWDAGVLFPELSAYIAG